MTEKDIIEKIKAAIKDREKTDRRMLFRKYFLLSLIQDAISTNGTKVNNTEIKGVGKIELKNGDKITLAEINNFTITIKISAA